MVVRRSCVRYVKEFYTLVCCLPQEPYSCETLLITFQPENQPHGPGTRTLFRWVWFFCLSYRDSLCEELRRCCGSGNSQNKCQGTCILAFPFWCVNNLVSLGISFPICKMRVCLTACCWWWCCLLLQEAFCIIPGWKKMEEESSAPLTSADKPGQQLCETQHESWPEPFRCFQPVRVRGWERGGGRGWGKGVGTGYVYNQAMWVSNDYWIHRCLFLVLVQSLKIEGLTSLDESHFVVLVVMCPGWYT